MPRGRVNLLTHCNAGWLATVDWGTATAPVYLAHDAGIPVHVWVDETRPRNQGAALTAWELAEHGVPHTVIADNVGGHLMQHGEVDLCVTGTDRTTAAGDVCNKIGTYLKALAARDNGVPFYVACRGRRSTGRWATGSAVIPSSSATAASCRTSAGRTADGRLETVRITPEASPVANYAFDVTPARLVTGLITERGVCEASAAGLRSRFIPASRARGGSLNRHESICRLRRELIATARRMNALAINQGTSGNVSARIAGGMLVTPSGVDYDGHDARPIWWRWNSTAPGGAAGRSGGRRANGAFTSTSCGRGRNSRAVVHSHPTHATALACLRRDIPAFHYMVAVAGGDSIRCAPYATFGSAALSDKALAALEDRRACLLANHGLIAAGADLEAALGPGGRGRDLAAQYCRALQLGAPKLLSKAEMKRVLAKFAAGYGYGSAPEDKRGRRNQQTPTDSKITGNPNDRRK